ncbi:MAG: isoprenylcysteine carboxylmethyltransferase family protein [candidate division Zixibacteria bacterium]|nr:isoprenylcysteine carboxylmethyltransferase family protein [candidate division Zixibacteria bacterium]
MSFELKALIFILVSSGIIWLSRASLFKFKSRGLYRLITWEVILILILYNIDYWFLEPLCIRQITSWFLLSVSSFMVIYGAWLLHKVGKPNRKRKDEGLIGIEKTTQLVTSGLYRYIRHPIYSSLLYGAWGVFLKHPSFTSACLTIMATFFLTVTAKTEEAENIRFFGNSYQDYMKQTKMFIPFIF